MVDFLYNTLPVGEIIFYQIRYVFLADSSIIIGRKQLNCMKKSVRYLPTGWRRRLHYCGFQVYKGLQSSQETRFSQLTDQFMVIRNYAKITNGLNTIMHPSFENARLTHLFDTLKGKEVTGIIAISIVDGDYFFIHHSLFFILCLIENEKR